LGSKFGYILIYVLCTLSIFFFALGGRASRLWIKWFKWMFFIYKMRVDTYFLFASVIYKIIEVHFVSQITMVVHVHVGWLDCPSSGQEICCMIPSKVPLGESFNDCIPPGKRYSFKQVIHQQRVLGRKVSRIYSENVILHLNFCFCFLFFFVIEFSSTFILRTGVI